MMQQHSPAQPNILNQFWQITSFISLKDQINLHFILAIALRAIHDSFGLFFGISNKRN